MFAAGMKAGSAPVTDRSRGDASVLWREMLQSIEPFLNRVATQLTEQVDAFDSEVAPYAHYALTNQGKRLRPALVALSAGASGKLNDSLVTIATIIEMVHLATLVHDDIMDHAEIRRSRPTLAANWGNEISVLLGDCLFAHALKLAASFPTPEICRAVAAATDTVCSGEILQIRQRCNFAFTRSQYFRVLAMKTGELFALSCDLGASVAGGAMEARAALRAYGSAVGTAYQIYDDCLDVFGSEAAVGKSLGTDLAGGKLTLPVLVALERASAGDKQQLTDYILAWQPEFLNEVVGLLHKYQVQDESRAVIRGYLDCARRSLSILPDTESRMALVGFADFLGQATDSLGARQEPYDRDNSSA